MKIVIIDTGCANLASLKFAIERLDYKVLISDKSEDILTADKVFLPGVGSAKFAMEKLKEKKLVRVIKRIKAPLLGICLGMQLLSIFSEENETNTIGLIDIKVRKLQSYGLVLPHMGWNTVNYEKEQFLFDGITSNSFFYFVHSFAIDINKYTIATSNYGVNFSAVIAKDNFYGVQFHPEKSFKAGSRLLLNFLENT